MTLMGERTYTAMTKRKLGVVITLRFCSALPHHGLGAGLTGARIAGAVRAGNLTLSFYPSHAVSAVRFVVSLLRMLFFIALLPLLVGCYAVGPSRFCPAEFPAVAFDSGGVTTGPMTVLPIMALRRRHLGHPQRPPRGRRQSIKLRSSIGPILAVMILGII